MLLERLRFEREIAFLNLESASSQAARAAQPFPTVNPSNRTIYVVDISPFSDLPDVVKNAALGELRQLFGFVGGKRGRKIQVVGLKPTNFPQSFAFSDAVVVLIKSASALQAHLTDSFRLQGQNAAAFLRQHNVTYSNPFANPSRLPINLERAGVGRGDRRVLGNRAFPYMGAYAALDEVMSDFVQLADSQIHASKVRQRRSAPTLDAKYWGSWRALFDARVLSVLDHPQDPMKWLWEPELFGQLIGRTMAHEVRHSYMGSGHAAAGLGSAGARPEEKQYSQFSPPDQKAIARAIGALELRQGRHAVVPTNPKGQPFPFE